MPSFSSVTTDRPRRRDRPPKYSSTFSLNRGSPQLWIRYFIRATLRSGAVAEVALYLDDRLRIDGSARPRTDVIVGPPSSAVTTLVLDKVARSSAALISPGNPVPDPPTDLPYIQVAPSSNCWAPRSASRLPAAACPPHWSWPATTSSPAGGGRHRGLVEKAG